MVRATQHNGSTETRPDGDGSSGPERGGPRGPRPLGESLRTLRRDVRELLAALEQTSASASDALREQIDERPYAVLGAGFVAGYVLGGGMTLRLMAILLGAAGRATIAQLVTRTVRPWEGGGASA